MVKMTSAIWIRCLKENQVQNIHLHLLFVLLVDVGTFPQQQLGDLLPFGVR